MSKPDNRQEVLLERLSWQVAERDDTQVAQALYDKEAVDGIYNADGAALLDEFFRFIRSRGVMKLMEEIVFTGVQRILIPLVQMALLYFLRVLYGCPSMNSLPELTKAMKAPCALSASTLTR